LTVAPALRQLLAVQARGRCGYCLTQEIVSGVPLTVEHILLISKGGRTVEENLWLSCRLCNEAKGVLT
jgi:5-methylcytosine-specific restriction endonuclease McrA